MILNQWKFKCGSLVCALVISQNAFAFMNGSDLVFTLSAGPSLSSTGETQTFELAPGIEKSYVPNKSTKSIATSEFFVGLQMPLHNQFDAQVGLALGVSSPMSLSGDIWDDADPAFNNYSYRYQVQHTRLALKGKLAADWGMPVLPWVSASLGLAYNRASSFSSTPTDPSAVSTPNFSNHSTWAFAYTLGFGAQHNFSEHWSAGLGYELADWGKSSLGTAEGQTMGSGLEFTHLYTHSILINLTYIQ